eukprot:CAMPEP_0195294888 /NCGR_PEP_ID=MMETSP0707-20130614/16127_1 /TAXON_ID=33640 /ORGANISM="Asterionellopsis glacialis, Strain CCMP134" /LENGTH=441 /DNA_ID=CAMNT_0040355977 /DNA_START=198 /DNA_END=1523 /DNA_ORIENTATION=-
MTDRHHNDVVQSVTSPPAIPQESSMMQPHQKTPTGNNNQAGMIDKENASNQQTPTAYRHRTPTLSTTNNVSTPSYTPSFRSSSKKNVRIAPALSSFQTPSGTGSSAAAASQRGQGEYQGYVEGPLQQTPVGTSKLLREQFQRVSVNTPTTNNRLIESGAVRLETPKSQPRSLELERNVSSDRIGYDGTNHTPSDELLRSTASSRGHQVKTSSLKPKLTTDQYLQQKNQDGRRNLSSDYSAMNETDSISLDSSLARANMKHHGYMSLNDDGYYADSSSSPVKNSSPHPYHGLGQHHPQVQSPICRQGCANPVALTLLNNDGSEDYEVLYQQEVAAAAHNNHATTRTMTTISDGGDAQHSTACPISPITPLSTTNSLLPLPPSSASPSTNSKTTHPEHPRIVSCPLSQTTNLRKVSSNLSDVKDEDDMATLVKPEPRRRQYSS